MCIPSHIPTLTLSYVYCSLVRNAAPGFSSVNSRRNTVIWVHTKRVINTCPPTRLKILKNFQLGCGGLQEQISFQGLDPQCMLLIILSLHIPRVDSSRSDHCQNQDALSLNNEANIAKEVWDVNEERIACTLVGCSLCDYVERM